VSKHGKAYDDAKQRFDRETEYAPAEAISLVKQLSRVKFNESVEVHVRTGQERQGRSIRAGRQGARGRGGRR
jgi:ribosomal protein L1